MFNKREAGLNFLQTRYKLLGNFSFIPYIRSNYNASIPYSIIDSFNKDTAKVALLKIYDLDSDVAKFRIKKLHNAGNSKVVSLKAERKIKNMVVKVLDITSQKNLLKRESNGILEFLPQFTSKNTPIYVFDYDSKNYFAGGYYKKDFFINKDLLNEKFLHSFLGLYLAEGGKTAASFTNSSLEAINLVLSFIENNFKINREDISASICCNPNLKSRKKSLELFWTDKTGISRFFNNLHLNNNVRSPQGIGQLYFSSEILKDLFVGLIRNLDVGNNIDFMNGFLSGDGSPLLQTKYSITHHIVFDPKRDIFGNLRYQNLFDRFNLRFINKNRLVLYPTWDQNLFLLLNGIYSFTPLKRFRFIKYFLALPRTKKTNLTQLDKLHEEYKTLKISLINFYKSLVEYNIYTNKEIEVYIPKELK